MRYKKQRVAHVELLFEFSDADVAASGGTTPKYGVFTSFYPGGPKMYPATQRHFKEGKWEILCLSEPSSTLLTLRRAIKPLRDTGFSTSGFFNLALDNWLDRAMDTWALRWLKRCTGYGSGMFCSQSVVTLMQQAHIQCVKDMNPRLTSPEDLYTAALRQYRTNSTADFMHVMPDYFVKEPEVVV
jgi:hypothetical protein